MICFEFFGVPVHVQFLVMCVCIYNVYGVTSAGAQPRGGGHLEHLPTLKISKHPQQFWHLQKFSKNKHEILYHFEEMSYLNFSLPYWLIISLLDLSWDRPSDRKFHEWLVFNHKYAGTIKTWEIV